MKRTTAIVLPFQGNQVCKTGGGMHCSKITTNDEKIASWVGITATGLSNDLDSDAFNFL